ncbi:hypothetical protein DNAM5_174 [Bacillus phage Vinny]|uniref:Uncharacterized protein n=1 Tax=Bacillus phage Vinny TaxID=1805955 RepID=A0A143FJA5_9CAUD|nr:hypothetical protein DNAM5_174 [Bacillus phage Vinny]
MSLDDWKANLIEENLLTDEQMGFEPWQTRMIMEMECNEEMGLKNYTGGTYFCKSGLGDSLRIDHEIDESDLMDSTVALVVRDSGKSRTLDVILDVEDVVKVRDEMNEFLEKVVK